MDAVTPGLLHAQPVRPRDGDPVHFVEFDLLSRVLHRVVTADEAYLEPGQCSQEFRHVRQQFRGDVLLFGFGFHRGVLRLVGAARGGAARTERLRCYEQDGDDAPSTRFEPHELISVCFAVVSLGEFIVPSCGTRCSQQSQ